MLYEMFIAMIAAMVYALSVYFRKNEPFDPIKFGATAIVGIIAGATLAILKVPVDEAGVAAQMMAYAGLAVVVENLLKKLKQYLMPE